MAKQTLSMKLQVTIEIHPQEIIVSDLNLHGNVYHNAWLVKTMEKCQDQGQNYMPMPLHRRLSLGYLYNAIPNINES